MDYFQIKSYFMAKEGVTLTYPYGEKADVFKVGVCGGPVTDWKYYEVGKPLFKASFFDQLDKTGDYISYRCTS